MNINGIKFFLKNINQFKYYFRFFMSLQNDKYYVDPWINFEVTDYFLSILRDDSKVFEYGSGQSTLFFAKKKSFCYSVEHSFDWYKSIKKKIPINSNVIYEFIPPKKTFNSCINPSDPDNYESQDENYQFFNFEDYVKSIDKFPDDYFDIVLIDGRSRPSCIKHACPKVKVGGCLVLDDSSRSYYLENCMNFLKNFEQKVFFGLRPYQKWTGETSIFIRMR